MLKVLRPKLVDEKFMKNVGKFLSSVQLLDSGSTQIQSATGLHSSCYFVFYFYFLKFVSGDSVSRLMLGLVTF